MNRTRLNSFGAKDTLTAGGRSYAIHRLDALAKAGVGHVSRLPYSLKILLENLLRCEDGVSVTKDDIAALASWDPKTIGEREIAFRPARVLLQDFTGVPVVVDLAAMRDAMAAMGGDPKQINPLQPVELVIDHSVQVDYFGTPDAFAKNAALEFERNQERYEFLKWGQAALDNFRVVPPDTGIVHQVNVEYLARVIVGADGEAYPDTLVGTDSHTTMVNGLGVVGWGVGGIEAEAAMLGQPVSMLIPEVVGFRLMGRLPEGVTATDLVLMVTQMLRKKGVVGKFVEFFGPGLSHLTVADRATLGNMSPEYGSTIAITPIDEQTLEYLRLTGRSEVQITLVEAYAKAQGLFRTDADPEPLYTDTLELDLSTVEPNLAGPRRPQDRIALRQAKSAFRSLMDEVEAARAAKTGAGGRAAVATAVGVKHAAQVAYAGETFELSDGAVVIAAITSCTNTSNPNVLMAAGLLAKKANALGLTRKPWVKTSLAPGSKVVTDYLRSSGLDKELAKLGFDLVGYGCTTCIGNSGPLPDPISQAITDHDILAGAVLSGNRNFEGRIHPQVRANYLASPPLCVAYALTGRMDVDLATEPLGIGKEGKPVYLKDIWPSNGEIQAQVQQHVTGAGFRREYAEVFKGDERWQSIVVSGGERYGWSADSTYVQNPPYFVEMPATPSAPADVTGARVLAVLGDSVTTDHISPAGNIAKSSPAGRYLIARGVDPKDFNSYGARRGNHEVMMRGTFANIRLRNALVPGVEGGYTRYLPTGEQLSIYDAAMKYQHDGTPLVILAGKEYGSGSSRDWAAKGTYLLGARAVIAESFERIHRSNLVGMGVLPLQFLDGEGVQSLGLDGEETYAVEGIASGLKPRRRLKVTATSADGKRKTFEVLCRIDTPDEVEYYRHGGILQYVLRQLAGKA
ncbi:MAG TPA: aconitate hydratase AcnA [Candidatus Dormibacteraeota bacterium]|nr:aconitate hydratase AcnA [Candidatus Dormibacteraeota bacterium]